MSTTSNVVEHLAARREGLPVLSWWGEFLTILLSVWTIAGAFLDGWAHSKVVQFESFFTP